MSLIYAIVIFIFGLIIGSFLNVVIFRIDDLKSILFDRSHCPKCKKILKWYDLIPFFSFMILRAKCRYCGEKISWQYPVVELGTGLLFLLLYFFNYLNLYSFLFYLIVFSILIVVFVYDIRTQLIPEVFVWIVLVLSLLGGWYFGGFGIDKMIFGGIVGGGFLAVLALVSKEKWMGYGDIKLGAILGLLTGFPNALIALFMAFLLGSIIGLIYIGVTHKDMKQSLPFAPFLIVSTLITVLFGNQIMNWYVGRFIGI